MSKFLDDVTDQLNLRWAWEKVRNEAQPGDIWFDEIELAAFELELEKNLANIAQEFRKGDYTLFPLKPLPFPKHPDKEGKPQIRQTFQVAIRDQVAWAAVVNVVGPYVDIEIPVWSYGNRLYRSIWVEKDKDGVNRRKIGRYRHASGRLYLPFRQSWPVFRRHIYLATRAMTNSPENLPEMDQRDKEEQELQARLSKNQRCPFVDHNYWRSKRPSGNDQELYWCCIDLKDFYPSVKLGIIRKNIVDCLPPGWKSDANRLLDVMLRFRLDLSDWPDDAELRKIYLSLERKTFSHIPTGLYVAGFLANAGLLRVDKEVQKHLTEHNVAHFRYVDDHIVLAYSFDELIEWVDLYTALLNKENTGTRINPEKIEPPELAEMLIKRNLTKSDKKMASYKKNAQEKCLLDPQFPSPLMTKTITLVSGIARTDFNLLDSNELDTLTDQLEHLLLADLPEEEMAKKTRLSFAAIRLTWVAERRLASDAKLGALQCKKDRVEARLKENNECDKPAENERADLTQELKKLEGRIDDEKDRLEREVDSAFQLLRKVLRERPDRVRLWTRAVLMCRLTGVKGLKALRDDIERVRVKDKNPLSAQYLMANLFTLLGTQALIAARVLQDQNTASWRRDAAKRFLDDLCENHFPDPKRGPDHGILHYSWYVYSFGLYCASLVIQDKKISSRLCSITKGLTRGGLHYVARGAGKHAASSWAWWAARKTLRDLSLHADGLVLDLGHQLKRSPNDAPVFWRFFPFDLPLEVLPVIAESDLNIPEGWWYDALNVLNTKGYDFPNHNKVSIDRAKHVLEYHLKSSTKSLHDWCQFVHKHAQNLEGDPRVGEWTALEIVRQIAELIAKEPALVAYIAKSAQKESLCLHPANFIVSSHWMNQYTQDNPLTWKEWEDMTKVKPIEWVPSDYRIQDQRYTPLKEDNSLFAEVNPVRGLGLLLYGLLGRCFELSTLWNGPGHSDLLAFLPRLLLSSMTCSSWTLGVLQACLLPRSTENLYLKRKKAHFIDEDTLRDPREFINAHQVARALMKCQGELRKHQLSTFGHKARQLTPVSIKQLTQPQWTKDFPFDAAGGTENV